jgi:hypothetical protein
MSSKTAIAIILAVLLTFALMYKFGGYNFLFLTMM